MKKSVVICTFILLLFVGAFSKTEAVQRQDDKASQLKQLVEAVEQQHAHVTKWSLYTRDQSQLVGGEPEFHIKAKELQEKYPSFDWKQIKQDGGHIRITGERDSKTMGVTEVISLFAYPHKGNLMTYLIYDVKGLSWNEKNWQAFSPTVTTRMSSLFDNNAQIFSCVTGEADATMKIALSKRADLILNHFSAEKVEQLKEKTFVSISAYTNAWKETIKTNQQEMNLQVGVRQVGDLTTITIGTPIITTEY